MIDIRKIPDVWAVWNNRLEFGFRVVDKFIRLISMGGVAHLVLKSLGMETSKTLWISAGAAVVMFIIAWLLSFTKLQKKADNAAAEKSGPWIRLFEETKRIQDRLEEISRMIEEDKKCEEQKKTSN